MVETDGAPNPLIGLLPADTLENIDAVLAFLQHQTAGEWEYEPGDRIEMGELLVFETVRQAVKSLAPHLQSKEATHG